MNPLSQKKVLFLCMDVDRGLQHDEKSASQVLDPAADLLEKKGIKIIRVRDLDSKMKINSLYKTNEDLIKIKKQVKFCKKIKTLFFNRKIKEKSLRRYAYWYLLKKHKPDLVVCVNPEKDFIRISQYLNVKIADVAHGFGYPMNSYYGPEARRKLLKKQQVNIFICFDEITKHTRKAGDDINYHKTLIAKRDFFPKNSTKILKQKKIYPKKIILIALQWGYEGRETAFKNIIRDGIMHDELKKLIVQNNDILWLIKFHPVQIRDELLFKKVKNYIQETFGKNVNNIVDVSNSQTEFLFKKVDWLITMSSMIVYEAAFEGVPSIALCPTLQKGGQYENYFQDLEESGLLFKSKLDVSSIEQKIKTIIKHRFAERKLYPQLNEVLASLI